MLREEKQVAFLKSHIDNILILALQNEGKIGYVQFIVTADFKLQSPPKFIAGKFNKKKFIILDSLKIQNPAGKNIKICYIRILWGDNHTVWEVQQDVEIFTIPAVGIPNSEGLN